MTTKPQTLNVVSYLGIVLLVIITGASTYFFIQSASLMLSNQCLIDHPWIAQWLHQIVTHNHACAGYFVTIITGALTLYGFVNLNKIRKNIDALTIKSALLAELSLASLFITALSSLALFQYLKLLLPSAPATIDKFVALNTVLLTAIAVVFFVCTVLLYLLKQKVDKFL